MKKTLLWTLFVCALSVNVLAGCEQQASQAKIKEKLSSKVYALSPDEYQWATTTGRQYFEQKFIDAGGRQGALVNCRPTDSNANGLVSCAGKVPLAGGGYSDVVMYCPYLKEMVACSDKDSAL